VNKDQETPAGVSIEQLKWDLRQKLANRNRAELDEALDKLTPHAQESDFAEGYTAGRQSAAMDEKADAEDPFQKQKQSFFREHGTALAQD